MRPVPVYGAGKGVMFWWRRSCIIGGVSVPVFCLCEDVFLVIFDVLDVEGFVFPSVDGVLRVRSLGLRGFGEVDWQFMRTGLVEDVLGLDSGWVGRRLGDAFGAGRHCWFDEVDYRGMGLSVGAAAEFLGVRDGDVVRLWDEGFLVGDLVDGELEFARAQFNREELGEGFWRKELGECVKLLRLGGVSASDISGFLFYPVVDYGFLTAAELLVGGDEGLRRLVLADAGAFMVEVASRRAAYEWRRVSPESVPAPEAVKKLANSGTDAWRLVELFNGKFDEWSFEKLAEGLGCSEALLLSRGYRWGVPRGWSLNGWSVEMMSKRCEVPVDELVGMQDDGLLVFERGVPQGGGSGLKVADFQFVETAGGSWNMEVCPVSLKLVQELLKLGWSAEDTARFLEMRSPWFGLVPPIEYARLGDEFMECVLYVAKVRGASAVRWRYKER